MSKLRALETYSEADLERASTWPAIERYRRILSTTPETFADQLRLKRHRAWLECALATALETATAREVCEQWSADADTLIAEAWRESGCQQKGYAVVALGKLGSRELNLSSDVDLILVRDDSATAIDTKALRSFQSLLTESTAFGFALRVDLTLRPGGRSAPIVPSISEFEYHYGYHGEPWERLAFVRLRSLDGPSALIENVTNFTRKFSYRKHLDFTLLDELKNLRSRIRQEKFETRAGAFHLKLGAGGIRELELFVHALQIIHGGRHASLRTSSTSEALKQIRELKLLPATECDELYEIYWSLRTLENRLHAFEDQQTYLVDLDQDHPALPNGFAENLKKQTARVCEIADSLFGVGTEEPVLPDTLDEQQAWLADHGFATHSLTETWPALIAATAQSRRTDKDEAERLTFLKGFAAQLANEGIDRDLGLSLLLDFVKATRAKASFFTLLNRETRVRDDLARLFSISPYLGSLLASRPELVDEFILRRQAEPSPDLEVLLDELAERRLVVELIASNQFLADHDLTKLCVNLTQTADTIVTDLADRLQQEYDAPNVSLIAMGKWGGRELGLRSDLDFVFTTPDEPTPNDQKLARRFLARMTEPHRGGSIYAVDMRLRPSGNSGPLLISARSLKTYLETQAAAWERQAYLRARPLRPLDFSPAHASVTRPLSSDDLNELSMIHAKLFHPSHAGELDLKFTDGGLADIEFTSQIALLQRPDVVKNGSLDPSTHGMIEALEKSDAMWAQAGPELRERYRFLRSVEQLYQLTTSQSGSKLRVKSDEFRRLAQVMKFEAHDLEERVAKEFAEVTDLLRSVRKDET